MNKKEPTTESRIQPRCCPSGHPIGRAPRGFTRRTFLKGMGATAVAGMALGKISWPLPLTEDMDPDAGLIRRPLKVKPILVYDIPSRRPQTTWRRWGGVQTRAAVDAGAGG